MNGNRRAGARISRRALLASGAAGLGCRPASSRPVLRVFAWAGAWGDCFEAHLKPLFERATGAGVVFDPGWGEEIPKLLIAPPGQPPYDVMIAAPFTVYAVIRRGYFERLDWRLIPNARQFHPSALRNWVAREDWGLTWPDARHTGIYRPAAVQPHSFVDLLAEAPGLYRAAYMSMYTFAAALSPGRAAQALDEDFRGVFAYARQQRSRIRHWWSTSPDMAFHLLQGSVTGGNIHSVDAYYLLRDGKPVAVLNSPDRAHFQAMWLIPKGTRHRALAHEFLNQFASAGFQRHYAAAGLPSPIPAVAKQQAEADPLWKSLNPHTDADFEAVRYYPYDTYVRRWTEMTERWNREVLV